MLSAILIRSFFLTYIYYFSGVIVLGFKCWTEKFQLFILLL